MKESKKSSETLKAWEFCFFYVKLMTGVFSRGVRYANSLSLQYSILLNSHWFWVIWGTSGYFEVLLCTFSYWVLWGSFGYFEVPSTQRYRSLRCYTYILDFLLISIFFNLVILIYLSSKFLWWYFKSFLTIFCWYWYSQKIALFYQYFKKCWYIDNRYFIIEACTYQYQCFQ